MNKAITLWIPELLNSYRIEEAAEQIKNTKLPWLTRLLAKADALAIKPKQSFYQTASYLFHQPNTLPIAPILASVELKNADLNEFWIKLDPVQLIADRDSLILIPAQDLAISQQESKQLLEAFNQHFAEDNLQLQYASKDSWLLSIVQAVDIQTTSIEELSYKPLHDAYPKGNAATFWKKLLNETQMLFYSHPVNEQRRNNNQPEINSIWAWGEGKLDTNKITARKQATIYSNNPYLQGIAKQTQAKYNTEIDSYKDYATKNKPKNTPEGGGGGKNSDLEHDLICLDSITKSLPNLSEQEWLATLEQLDKLWFEPLYQNLKTGKINSLLLDLGQNKRYHLEPKHLNRFWRFTKNITKF